MRTAAVIALALTTACASADPNARTTQQERIIVTSDPAGTVADLSITRNDYVASSLVRAAQEQVWPLLPAVYEQLGLPAPAVDAESFAVVVQNHAVRRSMGGARLSRYIECGADMTGQLADTYRVRISVRTWLVRAGATTTEVKTRVDATANSPERPDIITCSSRGQLEKSIAEALEERARR